MFFSTVATALFALPLFAQSAVATTCSRTYTVQEGEWCDTISAAHNVSTYQLAVVNSDKINKACTNLQAGSSICLGFQGEDCTTTHVVKAGDTCDGISNTYRINSTLLYHNNPQLTAECDNLYVGEVVCVQGDSAVSPLPDNSSMPAATIPPGAIPATPTKASSTPAPTPTPVPADDDDDDGDCDEEEEEEELPWCDELN
ncbi:unnamed protein product [Somion occarium]|uniref:LysM domain-containing protein n=1 Tax=Somion occarium TaxID=3059160 RepID=A0ABP1DSH6_9APHY